MKKFLLLLTLAFASAASFAQSPRPAAITITSEPGDEEFEQITNRLAALDNYTFTEMSVMRATIEPHRGCDNPYLKQREDSIVIIIVYEITPFLDEYYPNYQYKGEGLTVESCNEICDKYEARLARAMYDLYICTENFHKYYQPFKQDSEAITKYIEEIRAKIEESNQNVKVAFSGVVDAIPTRLENLADSVEKSMADNTLGEDYEAKGYGTELDDIKALVARLQACFDKANAILSELDKAKEAVETECPDVKSDFMYQLDGMDSKIDEILGNAGKAVENQETTDAFIEDFENLLSEINRVVEEARAAQAGFSGIGVVEADGNADAEFYNLQGVKVANPEAGMMLIKVDASGKAQKVIIR